MKSIKKLILFGLFTAIICSFAGCSALSSGPNIEYEVNENGTVSVVKYTDSTEITEIVIPDEYEGKPVTNIENFSLFNAESLKKITIGKNVSEIGEWAFTNNQALQEFAVDEDNEYFTAVDGVLYTKDMKTLLFYPSAKNIEFDKFGAALNTSTYKIPDGVETIRSKAFYKCYYVENIDIPESVTVIEEKAFHRCNALKDLVLPSNLKYIGKDAFAYCALLENITIPEKVEEIGEYAFFNCSGMKSITMLCDKDKVILHDNWEPTASGREIKDCEITWK